MWIPACAVTTVAGVAQVVDLGAVVRLTTRRQFARLKGVGPPVRAAADL
jgi:hypothetical protein